MNLAEPRSSVNGLSASSRQARVNGPIRFRGGTLSKSCPRRSCCRIWPGRQRLPKTGAKDSAFSKMPENYVYGVAQYFATAMPTRGGAIPLVVKFQRWPPNKNRGNSLHPDSNGGTDRYAQASILNLTIRTGQRGSRTGAM